MVLNFVYICDMRKCKVVRLAVSLGSAFSSTACTLNTIVLCFTQACDTAPNHSCLSGRS